MNRRTLHRHLRIGDRGGCHRGRSVTTPHAETGVTDGVCHTHLSVVGSLTVASATTRVQALLVEPLSFVAGTSSLIFHPCIPVFPPMISRCQQTLSRWPSRCTSCLPPPSLQARSLRSQHRKRDLRATLYLAACVLRLIAKKIKRYASPELPVSRLQKATRHSCSHTQHFDWRHGHCASTRYSRALVISSTL